MSDLRIGELFAGYGGLGAGVKAVYGGEVAWVSDIDPGANKILAHRLPGVPNLGDIRKIDWAEVETVDILTGGFPCQDVSSAGKRAGLIHGTRSGLWHEFARAIEELRPQTVVIENVRGLLSARGDTSEEYEAADLRVSLAGNLREWVDQRRHRAINEGRSADVQRLTTRTHRLVAVHRRAVADRKRAERRIVRAIGTVLGTLADLGYDASWHGLRAADVGAPHGRFRVFVVARDAHQQGLEGRVRGGERAGERAARAAGGEPALLPSPRTSDTNGAGRHGDGGMDLRTAVSLLPSPRATDGTKGGPNQRGSSGDLMLPSAVTHLLPTPAVNDMGEGKTPEAWDEWTERMRAAHGNGNGHGASLSIEAQRLGLVECSYCGEPSTVEYCDNCDRGSRPLLPTPRATRGGSTTETNARLLPTPTSMDSASSGGGYNGQTNVTLTDATVRKSQDWGQYAAAIHRWETLTRPAPPPTETGPKGNPRLSPAFSEWMMGLPAGWVTDVPGITRNEALRAIGNGVCPQQAAEALRVMASWAVAA